MASSRSSRKRKFEWERWSTEELLDQRLCDLGLDLEGTWLEGPMQRLSSELLARDLRVRPHFWLSDEWFSPEGVPGIAIPFFLAHPRLMRLERSRILEVEGGTHRGCLRLLRHEAGHAVEHAYRLNRRRQWQKLFGSNRKPYPEFYRPNPASRRYVSHLPYWYAQSHPAEDFAETFAVWLTPGSRWRSQYRDWPAIKKLEYVDTLMQELAGKRPPVRSRARPDRVDTLKYTLREYYAAKEERYRSATTNIYDEDLERLFRSQPPRGGTRGETAAVFLRRHRKEIRRMVARATGRHELALDTVIDEMIARCKELGLKAVGPRRQLVRDLAILLAARSVEYVYRGRDWHAL